MQMQLQCVLCSKNPHRNEHKWQNGDNIIGAAAAGRSHEKRVKVKTISLLFQFKSISSFAFHSHLYSAADYYAM